MDQVPEFASLLDSLKGLAEEASIWLRGQVFVVANLVQLAVIAFAFLAARWIGPLFARWLDAAIGRIGERLVQYLLHAVRRLTRSLAWLVLLWFAILVAGQLGWPHQMISIAVSLLSAWIVISFVSRAVSDPLWSRAIALCAWTVAALNIVGLLGPAIAFLDSLAIQFGNLRISVYGVIKAGIALAVLLWLANMISRLVERRINVAPTLTPSLRVLFGKLLRVTLLAIAMVAALNTLGLDLSALAIFGGALGLGVGFGLQKVVSNLVSGIILLLDRSVKPGDVIAVGGTYGWINTLSARYVSVITRDGIEHLIPNEELISQRVENWSYSDDLVRLRVPIGISYESDVRTAISLAEEAAKMVDRVLKDRPPLCLLKAFGNDAVELELRIWIADPQNGVSNVRSAVMLHVWDLYHEHGIEFPFAQRDLHLTSAVPLRVEVSDVR
jgi:small-conductance mechanosensitive channel